MDMGTEHAPGVLAGCREKAPLDHILIAIFVTLSQVLAMRNFNFRNLDL